VKKPRPTSFEKVLVANPPRPLKVYVEEPDKSGWRWVGTVPLGGDLILFGPTKRKP